MTEISLKDIMSYFDMKASDFMKEWKDMTPRDKEDIKTGIANGTLTYADHD